MSSTMTTESHQDPGNRPTGSDSSLAVTEDVLRAAALRSLKEKRKKQQTVSSEFPSLPSRPAVSDPSSIQLDYGQADSPSSIASSSAPLPTATKADAKMDVDDAAREEGEISDSEEEPDDAIDDQLLADLDYEDGKKSHQRAGQQQQPELRGILSPRKKRVGGDGDLLRKTVAFSRSKEVEDEDEEDELEDD